MSSVINISLEEASNHLLKLSSSPETYVATEEEADILYKVLQVLGKNSVVDYSSEKSQWIVRLKEKRQVY